MLAGLFILTVDLGISRLALQKIAKYLFYFGIFRSSLLILFWIVYLISLFGGSETSMFVFFMMGLNTMTEVVTTVLFLRVVRLTNEIIGLINRKMLKGVTDGDFNYNC